MEVKPNKVRIVCPAWHRIAMQCMEQSCPYDRDDPRFERRVCCPLLKAAEWLFSDSTVS